MAESLADKLVWAAREASTGNDGWGPAPADPIKAAVVAALSVFAAHLTSEADVDTAAGPYELYLEGRGLERAANVALRVAGELEQGNGNQ